MKYRTAALNLCLLVVNLILAVLLVLPMRHKSDKMGSSEFTAAKLGRTERYIWKFYQDQHVWPDVWSWKKQLKPYIDQEGLFSSRELVTDAWGGDIEYQVRTNGDGPFVWLRSLGPNQADDNGTNDDIVFEVFNPDSKK